MKAWKYLLLVFALVFVRDGICQGQTKMEELGLKELQKIRKGIKINLQDILLTLKTNE